MTREQTNTAPRVTIVVTEHDRLSTIRECLENLYATATGAFDLVYVTGRMPGRHLDWIRQQAQARGFTHLHTGRLMRPAEARNFGARHVKTEHLVTVIVAGS